MSFDQMKSPLAALADLLAVGSRGVLPSKVMVLAPSIQSLGGLRRDIAVAGATPLLNVEFGTLPTFVNDLVKERDSQFWQLRISDQELYSLIRVVLQEISLEYQLWSDLIEQEELVKRLAASMADRAWAPPVRIEPKDAKTTSDLVEVAYFKVTEMLGARWTFDGQLFGRAEALIDDEGFLRHLRQSYPSVVLYMPHGLVIPAVRFAARLLSKVDGVVIYGRSGSSAIDNPFEELIPHHFFEELGVPVVECSTRPERLQIVDLPDARSEVTYVLQRVVAALEDGTDLTEVSINFSDRSRYLDLLRSSFGEVGITTSLIDDRKSSIAIFASLIRRISQLDVDTVFGDVINLLSDLKVGGFRCGEVLAVTSSPILVGNPKLFASNYDVVPPPFRYLSSVLKKLFTFAEGFKGAISIDSSSQDSWSKLAQRLYYLIRDFVRDSGETFSSLMDLGDGVEDFCEIVLRLREVDGFISRERPSFSSLWTIINSLIEEVDESRVDGVQLLRVQSVTSAPCLTSKLGFFLGVTDDVFPARPARSLLDGRLRERLGLLSERKAEALSNRSLALAIALCRDVVVTIPRVDVIGEKALHPAAILPTIEGLLSGSDSIEKIRFDSTLAMLSSDALPPLESSMVSLISDRALGRSPSNIPKPIFSNLSDIAVLDPSVSSGASLDEAKGEPDRDDLQVIAPTSIEEWIRCPYEYFVRRVLRVDRY